MANCLQRRSLLASRFLIGTTVFTLCLAFHGTAGAFSDGLAGYYLPETNQCPQALNTLKSTGKWVGLTITPIEMTFPDGTSCALDEETHGAEAFHLTLTCITDKKRSGVYEFESNDTHLVITRNREHQSYVKCRTLNSNGTSSALQNSRQNTGIDLGGGAKVHPYANNNSLRMKMNVPFP